MEGTGRSHEAPSAQAGAWRLALRLCPRSKANRIAACAAVLLLSTAVFGSPEGTWELVLSSAPPRPSEPSGRPFAVESAAELRPLAFAAASRVTVGVSFQTSEYDSDSGFIVPDTMGAVGPDHVVELINGNFEVFDRAGRSLHSASLSEFWTDIAGVPYPISYFGDPRIVYDPVSERFFASSLDFDGLSPNRIYLARSDSADPTRGWRGVRFAADTQDPPQFHDYETLGVDAESVCVCTNDLLSGGFEFPGTKSCYSIPKADVLLDAPSLANLTRLEELFAPGEAPPEFQGLWGSFQPASDFSGTRTGRMPLLTANGLTLGHLARGDLYGGGEAGAALGDFYSLEGDPGYSLWLAGRQPDPPVGGMNGFALVGAALGASVIHEGSSLWAVHNVKGSAENTAIRWYEIDEESNTVVQSGLIEDPALDLIFPSIAVNEFGQVVIGYTCTGPALYASACASAGETVGGVTEFDPPLLLRQGAGYYDRRGGDGRNRWGDYSATVAAPDAPCVFWTFQEFVARPAAVVGSQTLGGDWGTQATQLIFASCPVPTTTTSSTTSTTTTSTTSVPTTSSTTTSGPTTSTAPTTSSTSTTTTAPTTTSTTLPGGGLSGRYEFADRRFGGASTSYLEVDTALGKLCVAGEVRGTSGGTEVTISYRSAGAVDKASDTKLTALLDRVEIELRISGGGVAPYGFDVEPPCTLKVRLAQAGSRDRLRLRCEIGDGFSMFADLDAAQVASIDAAFAARSGAKAKSKTGRLKVSHSGVTADGAVSVSCEIPGTP